MRWTGLGAAAGRASNEDDEGANEDEDEAMAVATSGDRGSKRG